MHIGRGAGAGGRFGKRGYKNAMKRKNRFPHP